MVCESLQLYEHYVALIQQYITAQHRYFLKYNQ